MTYDDGLVHEILGGGVKGLREEVIGLQPVQLHVGGEVVNTLMEQEIIAAVHRDLLVEGHIREVVEDPLLHILVQLAVARQGGLAAVLHPGGQLGDELCVGSLPLLHGGLHFLIARQHLDGGEVVLPRDGVDVEAVAHVLDQPHGIGADVHGIAQNVEHVAVGVEADGGEEGLELLVVAVEVGGDVGHMVVLSARAGHRVEKILFLLLSIKLYYKI